MNNVKNELKEVMEKLYSEAREKQEKINIIDELNEEIVNNQNNIKEIKVLILI